MARGGHANSGPAPDPNALRRNRSDDAEWTTLPTEGRKGRVPAWPLPEKASAFEAKLWRKLWKKPQAVMWERLDMVDQLGAYVLSFAESVEPGASAGLKTAVLRMEAELGISIPGMRQLRWRVAADEVGERRTDAQAASATSVRDRLKAVQ